jgi:hypothetical protein
MHSELIQHLSKYVEVTRDLEEALSECALIKEYSKIPFIIFESAVCACISKRQCLL